MSAVYCGSKRSYLEDTPSPPSSKRFRYHGNDFNAAMKSLYSLVSAEDNKRAQQLAANNKTGDASGDDWVALLVREVTQSTGIDDAKVRVATVLEALEKVWRSRKQIPRGKLFSYIESVAVQQQVEGLIKDNALLKHAVAIQHERHKAFEKTLTNS
ncbi:hypothetical protein Bca52824_085036 [Brassica carinata]|uniref:Uncharacterized protein n=1 Tax=Brassica carinata TaxID=52824 RepID=A0A8X7PNU5_BRACI|nr:hypothetical protein Bca52824_085036 [Brassica carinata]